MAKKATKNKVPTKLVTSIVSEMHNMVVVASQLPPALQWEVLFARVPTDEFCTRLSEIAASELYEFGEELDLVEGWKLFEAVMNKFTREVVPGNEIAPLAIIGLALVAARAAYNRSSEERLYLNVERAAARFFRDWVDYLIIN